MEWEKVDPGSVHREIQRLISGGARLTGETCRFPSEDGTRIYVDAPDDPTGLLL